MPNRRAFLTRVLSSTVALACGDLLSLEAQQPPPKKQVPFLKAPGISKTTSIDIEAVTSRAAAPTEADLIKQLYSKIEGSFSLGSGSPYPGHSFLVLFNPGIFISPKLDMHKAIDRKRLSDLLNMVPLASPFFVVQDSGIRVPSIYAQIMQNHLAADYQLTQTQRQQLKAAESLLKDSNKMDNYVKYQRAYAKAADALANARIDEENGGSPVDSQLIINANQAKHDWEIKGYMYQVNRAQEVYDELLGGDPTTWWHDVRQKFDGDPNKFVDVIPGYDDWMSDSGWDSRTMDSKDWMNQSESSSTDVGGGFSGGWGLWRAGLNANYHVDEGFTHSEAKNMSLKFEVMRVDLIRDWIEPLVFKSRNWIWNNPQTDISSGGDASSGVTPSGLMPFFPTGALLARNVELSADFSQNDHTWMNKVVDGSTSVGWGPFSLSGHYHHEEHSDMSSGSASGATVKTKPGDVQLLGFFCDVLPHCPDKNPDLQWPKSNG